MSPTVKHLFELLEQRNLSLMQIGNKVGIDNSQLSKWKRGLVEPSIASIDYIAECFGYRLKLEPIAPELHQPVQPDHP